MRITADGKWLNQVLQDEYDLDETITAAKKAVRAYVKVPLTNNQFSALVPLVRFIGINQFRKSNMLKTLNSQDRRAVVKAAQYFDYYIYTNCEHGRIVDPFLVKQRELEKALFLKPELV